MVNVEIFSDGKSKDRNEDFFGYNENCFVIADGATDKSGKIHDGKTGGEIISRLIVEECLKVSHDGKELVEHLNKAVKGTYSKYGISDLTVDPKYRFTSSFICVRISASKIVVTSVGDCGFRVDGKEVYKEIKESDQINSKKRANYIEKTGDIEGGRDHIIPFLIDNFKNQNNADSELGFGVIDGTETPGKFISLYKFNVSGINTIEMFTDGYLIIPDDVSIKSWEDGYRKVKEEDPYRYKEYKETKIDDDRTIAIIKFNNSC
ncbi:hypothetical protein H6503_04640 [Candidatus Woesearchaeota archaeon]|nr:hypothetical protein [Candidatus Woesearchaeota archaeon]